MQLTAPGRQRVRDAVRTHPAAAALLGGRRVNALTKDELLDLARTLGLDARAIAAGGGTDLVSGEPLRPAALAPAPAPAAAEADPAEADPAAGQDWTAEAEALRRDLTTALIAGDFDTLTLQLRTLLADAHRPPRVEYVASNDPGVTARAPTVPPPVASVATWGNLFGLSGPLAAKRINVYRPGPLTPATDARYRWPADVTQAALSALTRGRNVWLYGPAGTGKTSFAEQLAARTGRPFFLIPCDDTTEAPELIGMTVPHAGGVRWQDGVLTAAMRAPHSIVLIDEPTVARAGAVMVLQSVLQNRTLSIKETGELVVAAEGVRFLVADNTNGTGGGSADGYEGTRRMNRATLDRFSAFLRVDYMDAALEAETLADHTGCTPELAKILVECAGLTRKARVTHAIGLRRLLAWAEALTDGIEPRAAFEFAILNSCAADDREPTEQCCALGLNRVAIRAAVAGRTPPAGAAPAPRSAAAADFAS